MYIFKRCLKLFASEGSNEISLKRINKVLTSDNLRLARTQKGNIIMVIAFDPVENKAVVGKFDNRLSKLIIGEVSIETLYILSLKEMESLKNDQNDPNRDIRDGLDYLIETGIPFKKEWGLFNWNQISINENLGKNNMSVEVLIPKMFLFNIMK